MARSSPIWSPQSPETQGMLPHAHSAQLLRLAGLISILAATGNVVADLVLQYKPEGSDGNIAFIGIAAWRIFTGHFLGIFCLPLEIVGYWLVCTLMLEQGLRLFRVLFWIMAYGIIMGTVFHALFTPTIFIMQAASNTSGPAQSSLLSLASLLNIAVLPLVIILFISYLTTWSIFTVAVLRKPSPFPRWIVFFTPALLSILITALYMSHIVPFLGNLVYPTVLSLPHLVFYIICTVLVWRRETSNTA